MTGTAAASRRSQFECSDALLPVERMARERKTDRAADALQCAFS